MTRNNPLLNFESLGDGGRLGLVQRAVGLDRPGLLRFADIPMPGLLDLLGEGFERFGAPDDVVLVRDETDELIVHLPGFGARIRTHIRCSPEEDAAIRTNQIKRIGFLKRRLQDDLAEGGRILVRTGDSSATPDQVRHLLQALRAQTPNTLFWVVPADATHPAGTVAMVQDGLLRGHVGQHAEFDISAWLNLYRSARSLLLARDLRPAPPPPSPQATGNLLRQTLRFEGNWWRKPDRAASDPIAEMPPPIEGAVVMTHRLVTDTDQRSATVFGQFVPGGLMAGLPYVASAFVWVPVGFAGRVVGLVLDGFASTAAVNADLDRRGCWQRISVQAWIPDGMSVANPSLYVVAPAGALIHSACWKLEQGQLASAYSADQDAQG